MKVKEQEHSSKAVFSSQNELDRPLPQNKFLTKCIDEQDLAMPLLDKIRGKTLCL